MSPTDKNDFFQNYRHTAKFIKFRGPHLEKNGICVVEASGDADTTIVKEALLACVNIVNKSVTVVADDTDILGLLHHYRKTEQYKKFHVLDTRKGQKEERRRISVEDIARANHDSVGRYVLFEHSFNGSDTTSSIYNYGKTKILDKIRDSPAVRVEAEFFLYRISVSRGDRYQQHKVILIDFFSNRKPIPWKLLRHQ